MLDQWQAKQRAQKEDERKAKTEATAAIQGYRRSGLSEEETKLAGLREQQRMQKTEATAAIQGYRRSGLSEEETKLAAFREEERMQKLNAEHQLHGYRGQQSEEEVKLAAQKQEELRRRQELELQLRNNGAVPTHDPITRDLPMVDNGVVSALAAGYSSPSLLKQPQEYQQRPTSLSSSSNEKIPQPDFTAAVEAAVATPTVAVYNNDHTTMAEESNIDAVPGPASIIPDTATHDAFKATPRTTTPIISTEQEPFSTLHHSTVMFMFGILTADDVDSSSSDDCHKLVEGYLARADQISKSVIMDNSDNNNNNNCSSFGSILSTLAYPVTKSIEKDHSRTDVFRTMVTVAISFSALNETLAKKFQDEVVESIRFSISNGSFTKISDDQ
mmetsp:Transcript_47642/g.54019  ORF Transcript_47642/g.54019 Transcript_47642/m.54019 type:complete len:387 (-) Transcript_47642:165-1325(-)